MIYFYLFCPLQSKHFFSAASVGMIRSTASINIQNNILFFLN